MSTKQAKRKDPLANYMPVSIMDARELILDVFYAQNWVANLVSSPGLGKSSLIKQIAKELNLLVIDVRLSQLDPADLNGFPHVYEDENGRKRATYVPMDMFPIEGDDLPINPATGQAYAGWILFLDEFNAATPLVQAAAYKLILDHMVGMHKLHSKCKVVSAGNMMSDKAIVNRQSTATQSRIAHIVIKICHDSWHYWADGANVDIRVRTFLKWKTDLLHNFDPNHEDLTFACPRTWEMTSDIIKNMPKIPRKKVPLLAGCTGRSAAKEFYAFSEVFGDLPDIAAIRTDPTGIHIRDEPSVHWGLAGLIGQNLDNNNAKELVQFVKRLGPDFQVIALRQGVARDMSLLDNPEIMKWQESNTEEHIRRS